jgi:uncharacterized membrane protein YphA (DoxX/SURF4 family)
MSQRRALLIGRLVLGALLVRQGTIGMSDLVHLAGTLERHTAWQAWPLVGDLRPMALALWLAGLQFAVGVFLFGGLLTRVMAAATALLALFALLTLGSLGLAPTLAHGALLLGALAILLKGGGAHTMDTMLGGMQRRSMEREAERDAERQAERQAASSTAIGTASVNERPARDQPAAR